MKLKGRKKTVNAPMVKASMFSRPNYSPIEKPRHKRLPVDRFSGLAIPVTPRVKSRKALEEARKRGRCEMCGRAAGYLCTIEAAHSIHSKGAGGNDEPGNLLSLCVGFNSGWCHHNVHQGVIPRETVIALVKKLGRWKD